MGSRWKVGEMMDFFYPVLGKQERLPFYLAGIGVANPEYHVVREPGLISHQISYTLAGKGELLVGGESYVLEEGSLFYIAPGIPHEYYPIVEDDWTTCWVVFRGDYLGEIMPKLGFDGFVQRDGVVTEELRKIFRRMESAAQDPVWGDEKCSVLVYEYIMAVRRTIQSGEKNGGRGMGSILDEALMHIHAHYAQDITLEELAGISGVTKQHFCRVFKAKTGMRPMEYLARKRIAEARGLLLNTKMPVAEIGKMVGYENLTYFGMVFKKYEGISPTDCRKRRGTALMW